MSHVPPSTTIKVIVSQPVPPKSERPRPTVEAKVRSLVEDIENGDMVNWKLLCKFYKCLCSTKQTPKVKSLRKMISPILHKYGYYGRVDE
jgi:16S rRNA A1518/A1519 N6-dimethyltransferase RsmA/KsgA/DIM1 with predicted DNA glycosylase/AP lyase activity